MVDSYNTCSSVISLFLLILAILEIIITAIPLIVLPDLLRFTGTHTAALCGLVAGLVTLPASIRLKFNETNPDLERLHGHTSFFKKLTLFVSLLLNIIATTITVIALVASRNFAHDFGRLMKVYHCNIPARILVNVIQEAVECCGAIGYRDWLSINWKMYEVSNDESNVEEDNTATIPYSCCSKAAMYCGHYDLRTYGTCSINKSGCGKYLRMLTKRYLWILFTLYMVNVLLEILLMVIYFSSGPESHHPRQIPRNHPDTFVAQYSKVEDSFWDEPSHHSLKNLKTFDKLPSFKDSGESEELLSDSSLEEDETPELTSSHKMVRIYSPLGKSRKNIKIPSE